MARIDKYEVVALALRAVTQIHSRATLLRNSSSAIPFRDLQSQLDAMRSYYMTNVQTLLDLGNAAQVNPVINTFFTGSAGAPLPANPYTTLQAIGSALSTFYNAYDVVFETLDPINFSPETGHVYENISLGQLATLSDELDAVISAAAPLL